MALKVTEKRFLHDMFDREMTFFCGRDLAPDGKFNLTDTIQATTQDTDTVSVYVTLNYDPKYISIKEEELDQSKHPKKYSYTATNLAGDRTFFQVKSIFEA